MSVTFAPEMAPIIGYQVADVTGGRSETIHANYDKAGEELSTRQNTGQMLPGCTDPEWVQMSGMHIDILTTDCGDSDGQEVNVSNTNAAAILEALGLVGGDVEFSDVCSGVMDPAEFQGRVLTALAIAPADEGMPEYEMSGSGARMIQCGRRPGYLQDRLAQLHDLAQWCVEQGRSIVWS